MILGTIVLMTCDGEDIAAMIIMVAKELMAHNDCGSGSHDDIDDDNNDIAILMEFDNDNSDSGDVTYDHLKKTEY